MPQLNIVNYAKIKLQFILEEINKLKHSDFPEESVINSLNILEILTQDHINRLDRLPPQPQNNLHANNSNVWATTCQSTNQYISQVLPTLGFILRSTNVRNAFELYDPILLMCRKFFGQNICLILSSEWDFSPLTYPVASKLDNYVFIGMPVSEAGNALIIPLVGHEVAHSIWRNKKLSLKIEQEVKDQVMQEIKYNESEFKKIFGEFDAKTFMNELFFIEEIKTSTKMSIRQCEEEFCDLFGCRIFGDSYLDAFEYLLAPGFGQREVQYLDLSDRANILITASKEWEFSDRPNYTLNFNKNPPPKSIQSNNQDTLLLKVSDSVTKHMSQKLMGLVVDICNENNIPLPNKNLSKKVLEDFYSGVPSDKAKNYADIVNAGWEAMKLNEFWNDRPELMEYKLENLSQLIFKSIEVAEYNRRISNLS